MNMQIKLKHSFEKYIWVTFIQKPSKSAYKFFV